MLRIDDNSYCQRLKAKDGEMWLAESLHRCNSYASTLYVICIKLGMTGQNVESLSLFHRQSLGETVEYRIAIPELMFSWPFERSMREIEVYANIIAGQQHINLQISESQRTTLGGD